MGSIIGWLVGRKILGHVLGEKGAKAIAIVGLILVFVSLAALALWATRKDAVDDHKAKVEAHARPATDKAASERARDAIHNARNEQEAHDVIAAQPDQPIAPTSRALSCKRLRDLGRTPPACR